MHSKGEAAERPQPLRTTFISGGTYPMRKMIAAIAAVLMLGSTAFAADYTPGQKITFDGTEAIVWDGEVKDINKENYSILLVLFFCLVRLYCYKRCAQLFF